MTTHRVPNHPVKLSCLLVVALALLGACGDDEAEASEGAQLSAEQATRLRDYCRADCEANQPGQEAWLRDVCIGGCETRHREEMAAGTWEPPAAPAAPAGGGPAGCPDSTECMQTCQSQCESQHGPMMDLAALRACIAERGADNCNGAGQNLPATNCFRTCRGLPAL